MNALSGRRAMVTGATGFLGGRLVERLVLEHDVSVRALVSSYSRCARIARFPIELVRADLRDREAVLAAAEGCDLIFHCAYGSRGSRDQRRRVTVEGTDNVVASAAAVGARLIHVSSQMVYGVPESGDLDESAPRRPSGGTYGDSKLEAEERVLQASAEGLAATVVQPTAIYGPYAPVWTVGVLERMRQGRVPLIAGGEGACNAVYVDDAVEALIMAARSDAALGESFLVSAGQPVTWREFYGHYEAMLGVPATFPLSGEAAEGERGSGRRWLLQELPAALLSEPELRSRLASTVEGRLLSRLYRALAPRRGTTSRTPELDRLRRLRQSPEPPVHPLAPSEAAFFASRARVRIDKARRLIGYHPRFDLRQGMELTGAWARWAGLVPAGESDRSPVTGAGARAA